jgi:uncharacterized delta-60 repeat protein
MSLLDSSSRGGHRNRCGGDHAVPLWTRQRPVCGTIEIVTMLVSIFIAVEARAQTVVDTFNPNVTNGQVSAILVQPDGKVLIGGSFTTLAPNGGPSVVRNRIARLNPDGTLDAAFNPNANGSVLALALQADGKVLVGGDFSTIGGQTRYDLARLDATTGAADAFDPGTAASVAYVVSLAVQADEKILAGGLFSQLGGQPRFRLARLDSTTGLADSFDPNPSNSVSSNFVVSQIVIQPNGKIVVIGGFTSIWRTGAQSNRPARSRYRPR